MGLHCSRVTFAQWPHKTGLPFTSLGSVLSIAKENCHRDGSASAARLTGAVPSWLQPSIGKHMANNRRRASIAHLQPKTARVQPVVKLATGLP